LQATHDGDDLDPSHLKLLELAVNGFLNEKGEAAFEDLYQQVLKGYMKPWLHGVENLTIDHTGYVKWKGTIVEHYSHSPTEFAEREDAAKELGRRCAILEGRGETPTMHNVIWTWPDED